MFLTNTLTHDLAIHYSIYVSIAMLRLDAHQRSLCGYLNESTSPSVRGLMWIGLRSAVRGTICSPVELTLCTTLLPTPRGASLHCVHAEL